MSERFRFEFLYLYKSFVSIFRTLYCISRLLPKSLPSVHPSRIHQRRAAQDILALDEAQLAALHAADLALGVARVELLVRREAVRLGERRGVLVREREDRMRLREGLRDRVRERRLRRRRVRGRAAVRRVEVREDERGEEVADAGEVAGERRDVARVHRGRHRAVGRRGGDAEEEVGVGLGVGGATRRAVRGGEAGEEPRPQRDGADDDVGDVVVFVQDFERAAEGREVSEMDICEGSDSRQRSPSGEVT